MTSGYLNTNIFFSQTTNQNTYRDEIIAAVKSYYRQDVDYNDTAVSISII